MLAAWFLVASTALAADVEIGDTRRFGVGVAAGYPPSATLKYFFDPKNGLSMHVGPALVSNGLHTRIQFEQQAAILGDWDVGQLGLTWNLGVAVNFVFGQNRAIRPGLGLAPKHLPDVIGSVAVRELQRGEPLNWPMLQSLQQEGANG